MSWRGNIVAALRALEEKRRLNTYGQRLIADAIEAIESPIPMILRCPACGARHIDAGRFATKPHHTHACQTCGDTWRPAIEPTVGVQFLPGFKDDDSGAVVSVQFIPGFKDEP